MNSKEIIEKLEDDKHYYGKFGRQFLSNSDINTLIKGKPEDLYKPKKKTSDMLIGGYFHTIILEPEKVKSFKIIDFILFIIPVLYGSFVGWKENSCGRKAGCVNGPKAEYSPSSY